MKQEQLFKNIDDALGESKSMLDNLAAVKGDAYANVVHKMLLATQIQDLMVMISKRMVRPESEIPAAMMMHTIDRALGILVAEVAGLSGIGEGKQDELIADCERIRVTTQGLLSSAHKAAEANAGFGGRDAD